MYVLARCTNYIVATRRRWVYLTILLIYYFKFWLLTAHWWCDGGAYIHYYIFVYCHIERPQQWKNTIIVLFFSILFHSGITVATVAKREIVPKKIDVINWMDRFRSWRWWCRMWPIRRDALTRQRCYGFRRTRFASITVCLHATHDIHNSQFDHISQAR